MARLIATADGTRASSLGESGVVVLGLECLYFAAGMLQSLGRDDVRQPFPRRHAGATAGFMRRTTLLAALLALAAAPGLHAQRAVSIPSGLADDVRYLADDRLGGRLTGTAGADSAAEYLARRFAEVGLQPARDGWFDVFTIASDAPGARSAGITGKRGRNVIGILPGHDPQLRREAVIVGAHYDHLGGGVYGSLDSDTAGSIHNGADDNASGAAALIHIARALAADPPARTVVFIAFAGEEQGLLGSADYVKDPLYALDRTVAMINLDMIGRLRDRKLIVYGTATAKEFPALLDSLNWYQGFDLRKQGDGYGPSDQSYFYAAGRPVLHIFTDLHEDYHRPTDDWQKVNFEGMARIIDFTAGLTSALGGRGAPLTFVEVPRPTSHAMADRAAAQDAGSSYGAYLGSIPDMTSSPGGVRLMGVRKDSPADRAGLRAGDVITRIGDQGVPDLQAMTNALRSFKPGDTTEIVVIRDDRPLTLKVTFGKRD